jgi:catechol 2,3-dioxygenase-like lactoylglutathione lyase family enzyme
MPQLRVSHIGICVSDAERSLHFYRDVFGFRLADELTVRGEPSDTLLRLKDVDLRAIYLERDGVRIELLVYASPGHAGDGAPRAMNALGLTHLSLRVGDVDAFLPRIESAGGRVLADTRIDIPEVRTRAIFVTDPDGTLIELVQQPGD